jgi:exoribonuclease R
MKCRILIDDRDYTSWKFHDFDTNLEINNEELERINPIELKLFTNDIIEHNGHVCCSNTRKCPTLAGTLILEQNKTYGRTQNGKRPYYKCIPDDYRLPVFLVPYDMKMGFSKRFVNKYVVFQFDNWDNKHPTGMLMNVLGDVDDLKAFYEYQLYRRNISHTITEFTSRTKKLFKKDNYKDYVDTILQNPNFKIEERLDANVFSIDPKGSKDLDDAFSIKSLENGQYRISVYIANVYFWMETFGLWESLNNRVSTIYLPDRRRPMLPTILSDNLCSLLEKQLRFAFCMDVFMDENGNIMKNNDGDDHIEFKNVMIRTRNNFAYGEPRLSKERDYNTLYRITKCMKYDIEDSHDVVAQWMIFMNSRCGEFMVKRKVGIFRSAIAKNTVVTNKNDNLTDETQRVIDNWKNLSGQYIVFDENADNMRHDVLKTNNYVHMTSPIRRLVDLLNQLMFFCEFNMVQNQSSMSVNFLKKWLDNLDYINDSMRSVRKVQNDCEMMTMCVKNPDIVNQEYSGVIFDKIIRNNGVFTYMVYIEKLKLFTKLTTDDILIEKEKVVVRLYVYMYECNSNKRVRVEVV